MQDRDFLVELEKLHPKLVQLNKKAGTEKA